jgi:cardiolipin synthase A/B
MGCAVKSAPRLLDASAPEVAEDRKRSEPDGSDEADQLRRTLEGVVGVPATEGNHVDVLRNGDEIFPPMLDAIERADHTIDFLTFIYWEGDIGWEFANRFADRARAGVRVRVLLDAWGAHPMHRSLLEHMEDNGVRLRWFRPLRRFWPGTINHRTHRKVLITDEAIGFTGGVGIADEWRGDARDETEWRDTHFRIEGPAVDGLRAAFLDNWAETDPELFDEGTDRFPDQPKPGTALVQCVRGASETGWSDVATLYRTLLQLARRQIRLTTPYFVPDADLADRLCAASDRGVDVQILLPGPFMDKRFVQIAAEAEYDRLLEHGITIWNFQPTMLHAKAMTVDGLLANVGSANFNPRSVTWDEEINVVAIDEPLTTKLDTQFEEDLERSEQIQPGRWARRSLLQRTTEQLIAPIRRYF